MASSYTPGADDVEEPFVWTKARITKLIIYILLCPMCMCGAAGRWYWWQPYFVVLAQIAIMFRTSAHISKYNKGLFRERERFTNNPGTAPFDKVLAPAVILFTVALYLAGGLQHRLQPDLLASSSSSSPASAAAAATDTVGSSFAGFCARPGVQATAAVVDVLGIALMCWAIRINTWFSSVVRLQTDRNHKVCSSGPYKYVRHPGYIGVSLQGLAEACLLQSSWALLVCAVRSVLLMVRTVKEERFLWPRLPGYTAYAAEVKWRWVPYVW